jgi:hypothetical protein
VIELEFPEWDKACGLAVETGFRAPAALGMMLGRKYDLPENRKSTASN